LRSPIKDELKGEVATLAADRDHWRKRAEAAEALYAARVKIDADATPEAMRLISDLETRLKAAEAVCEAAQALVKTFSTGPDGVVGDDDLADELDKALAAWRSTVRGETK
jgi:7-keto-8-aminopelargonate synthetase-like enzyme